MWQWISVFCSLFMASAATSIKKEEIEADALVRFHWSESNKRRNNTEDVRGRAAALDGQLATIMKPPFGPFWFKNPRRIVIQSLDDPDIILAVKMRNLQLEQSIKILVFHARNDSLWSEEYLRKEREFCGAPGIDYTHTYQASLRRLAMDELPMEVVDFVNNIILLPDPVDTAHQWMTTIKKYIAGILWNKYQNSDSSSSFDDGINMIDSWTRYDHNFRETLKIHFKSIHQHGGIYQEMRWPSNNGIRDEWLFQGMDFWAYTFHDRITSTWKLSQTFETSPITKMIQDVVERDETAFNEMLSTVHQRIKLLVMQHRAGSFSQSEYYKRFVSTLMAIPQYVKLGIKSFQEVGMVRDIGKILVSMHQSLSQGDTIAIAVPGDIIPEVERLEKFLHRVIKKVGLKHKCKVEVTEI